MEQHFPFTDLEYRTVSPQVAGSGEKKLQVAVLGFRRALLEEPEAQLQ